MIRELITMCSYTFMVRALIVGSLISLCAALLGVNLVLKRFSMIGDGLSHVGFGAMAIAVCMNLAPLYVALPVVIAAAFILMKLNQNGKMPGDAAIGLISSSALAIGVMAISVVKGVNVDISSYMFGSILALSKTDTVLSVILSICVIASYVLLYPRIFAITFDDTFAKATGTKTNIYNTAIALLTAVTVVLGMRMMGTLLISSLIIFPALISMRIGKRFLAVVIGAGVSALVCFFSGMLLSYSVGTPAGASIVCVNVVVFLVACVIGTVKNHLCKSGS